MDSELSKDRRFNVYDKRFIIKERTSNPIIDLLNSGSRNDPDKDLDEDIYDYICKRNTYGKKKAVKKKTKK